MARSALKISFRVLPPSFRLAVGAAAFVARRSTPGYAYQSLIRLFCLTGGWSNDLLARLVSVFRWPYRLPPTKGALGDFAPTDVELIARVLRDRGYHVFARRLPEPICRRMLEFARKNRCILQPTDSDIAKGVGPRITIYNREAPEGIMYQFDPEDLVNQPDVQALMADPSIIAIAQAYIGSRPVLDEVNLWWITAFSGQADAAAAQLYHFDMDRIRWLKFFIYLTDVGPENGPHCFVAGSHRTGGIPQRFLDRGYVRLPDAEVEQAYAARDLVEITGPSGTVFAEDTRGLHKGKPVLKGDRLVLEFEFSSSMFGATPPKRSTLRAFHSPSFETWVHDHRRLYSPWL